MSETAEKANPKLWDKVKGEVTKGDKGGKPGQWSARKAQLAVSEYKKEGGSYKGRKSKTNHLQQWQDENWGTESGRKSQDTGERYLPKAARDHLDRSEYARTTAKKRRDSAKGKQFSAQPQDIAEKTSHYRASGHGTGSERTKADLYSEAKRRQIPGRSRMNRKQLEDALA